MKIKIVDWVFFWMLVFTMIFLSVMCFYAYRAWDYFHTFAIPVLVSSVIVLMMLSLLTFELDGVCGR